LGTPEQEAAGAWWRQMRLQQPENFRQMKMDYEVAKLG